MSHDAEETDEFVMDHKLVWTGWKNNPAFKLAQEKQAEAARAEAEVVSTPPPSAVANPPRQKGTKGMYLSSRQAGERLGVTRSAVRNLVKSGKLKNYWVAPDDRPRVRQPLLFDPAEVRELAKTYRNFKLPGRLKKLEAAAQNGKGKRRGPYKKRTAKAESESPLKREGRVYLISEDSPVQGFLTRIKALEKGLEEVKDNGTELTARMEEVLGAVQQLVKLWS